MSPPHERLRRSRLSVAVVGRLMHAGTPPSTTLLVHYPKSGSTWLRMLVRSALFEVEPDFDRLAIDVPPLGLGRPDPSAPLLHSHHALVGAPAGRLVHLVRDPADLMRSSYRHDRNTGRTSADFASWCRDFVRGRTNSYGSYERHLRCADRTLERSSPVLVTSYGRLTSDTEGELARVLRFMEQQTSVERVRWAVGACSRESMRRAEATSHLLAERLGEGEGFVAGEDDWHRDLEIPVGLGPELAEMQRLYEQLLVAAD